MWSTKIHQTAKIKQSPLPPHPPHRKRTTNTNLPLSGMPSSGSTAVQRMQQREKYVFPTQSTSNGSSLHINCLKSWWSRYAHRRQRWAKSCISRCMLRRPLHHCLCELFTLVKLRVYYTYLACIHRVFIYRRNIIDYINPYLPLTESKTSL